MKNPPQGKPALQPHSPPQAQHRRHCHRHTELGQPDQMAGDVIEGFHNSAHPDPDPRFITSIHESTGLFNRYLLCNSYFLCNLTDYSHLEAMYKKSVRAKARTLRLSINLMGILRTFGWFVGNGLDRSVQFCGSRPFSRRGGVTPPYGAIKNPYAVGAGHAPPAV